MEEAPKQGIEPESLAYTIGGLNKEFRQGEIISGIIQHEYVHDEDPGKWAVRPIQHPYAIIASQDCDLLQDYNKLQTGQKSLLNSVLILEARPFIEVSSVFPGAGGADRKRIQQNTNERFHYLSSVSKELDSAGEGIPDLLIDFRRFFAIPSAELSRQCDGQDGVKRRCQLADLYREHLQSRLSFYLQRVALPTPHMT